LKDQKPKVSFYSQDGSEYIIDLNSYEEYPANDPNDRIIILKIQKDRSPGI
jgi:hypothetical protein